MTTDPWSTDPTATPSYGAPPAYGQFEQQAQWGPPGKVRGTGFGILMFIITFGLYSWYWFYATSEEMKKHSGQGLGGGIALLIAVLVGVASPFLSSHEVGQLYERRGQEPPVTALTGLWVFPGAFLLVLPLVWWVKTNGALNEYWRSVS